MKRLLSTELTPLFKFFLPGLGAVGVLFPLASAFSDGWGMTLFALGVITFLALGVWHFLVPLKHVVALEHSLSVSNYRETIEVSYFEIESVSRILRRYDIVQVVFRSNTPFGRAILFMAPMRAFWFGDPPVVAFLRLRAAEAGV
jgi:hypothetical protein